MFDWLLGGRRECCPFGLLINDRNSCYLNASLQVFTYHLFSHLLLQRFWLLYRLIVRGIGLIHPLINSFHFFMQVFCYNFWLIWLELNDSKRVENASQFLSTLFNISLNQEQQDAHEFLLKLLPVFIPHIPVLFLDSLIFENPFEMSCIDMFRCSFCRKGRLGTRYKSGCTSLILNGVQSIEQLFTQHFKQTYLDNVYCEACNGRRKTVQKTEIIKLPPILMVHINRAQIDEDWNGTKNFDSLLAKEVLEFTCELVNKKFVFPAMKYQLVSYMEHLGSSSSFGHYVAYRKDFGRDKWWRLSDTQSSNCSFDTSYAYILLYQVKS